VHLPTIVTAEVTLVGDERIEAKLADGRVGTMPASEFVRLLSVGDRIEVAVLHRESPHGKVALSRAWARQHRAWERADQARDSGEPVAVTAQKAVKGGLVVDLQGLRAFLPASLADDHMIDLAPLVDETFEVIVVEADREKDRVVVSRREIVRRERRKKQKEAIAELNSGDQLRGKVAALLDFGVQVDLEVGVRGLVHRSELSWNRFSSIDEVVDVGDDVEVVVVDVNKGKRRIGLSIRRLGVDPFDGVEVGTVGPATITKIVEFGAFAKLESGAEGLIHLTELTEQPGLRPEQIVVPGEELVVKVIEIDAKRRRIGLSAVQALLL
jgi:small subunit ribosomal protein S1